MRLSGLELDALFGVPGRADGKAVFAAVFALPAGVHPMGKQDNAPQFFFHIWVIWIVAFHLKGFAFPGRKLNPSAVNFSFLVQVVYFLLDLRF